MRSILYAAIATLLVATSAQAADQRLEAKAKMLNAIEVTQQSRADRCGPQVVESIRLACNRGFDMVVARQKALIAELDYMVSVDAIGKQYASLKGTLRNAATAPAYTNGLNELVMRETIIELMFNNRYQQQSALEPKK